MKYFRMMMAVIGVAAISGCGGGGGGGNENDVRVNNVPIANAGADQNVATNYTITLDGSLSNDADGDALSYKWSLNSKPNGSVASLSSTTSKNPTLKFDVPGTYSAILIVSDGKVESAASTVTFTVVDAKYVYTFKNPNFQYSYSTSEYDRTNRFGCWDFSFEIFTTTRLSPSKVYDVDSSRNIIAKTKANLYNHCNVGDFSWSADRTSNWSLQTDASGRINAWSMHAYGKYTALSGPWAGFVFESDFYSLNTINGVIGGAAGRWAVDQYVYWWYKDGKCTGDNTYSCRDGGNGLVENPSNSNTSWWTITELQ